MVWDVIGIFALAKKVDVCTSRTTRAETFNFWVETGSASPMQGLVSTRSGSSILARLKAKSRSKGVVARSGFWEERVSTPRTLDTVQIAIGTFGLVSHLVRSFSKTLGARLSFW